MKSERRHEKVVRRRVWGFGEIADLHVHGGWIVTHADAFRRERQGNLECEMIEEEGFLDASFWKCTKIRLSWSPLLSSNHVLISRRSCAEQRAKQDAERCGFDS